MHCAPVSLRVPRGRVARKADPTPSAPHPTPVQVGTGALRNLDPYLMLDELKLPAKVGDWGGSVHAWVHAWVRGAAGRVRQPRHVCAVPYVPDPVPNACLGQRGSMPHLAALHAAAPSPARPPARRHACFLCTYKHIIDMTHRRWPAGRLHPHSLTQPPPTPPFLAPSPPAGCVCRLPRPPPPRL